MLMRKFRGIGIVLAFVISILILGSTVLAQNNIQIKINNTDIHLEQGQPYFLSGKVMLPIWEIAETLGCNVSKIENTSKLAIIYGEKTYTLEPGNQSVVSAQSTPKLSMPPVIKEGLVYAPHDCIQTIFGFPTTYSEASLELQIKIDKLPIHFSKSFSIEYLADGSKLLVDGEKRRLLLVQEGMATPKNIKADAVIKIPLKNVLASSTTHVGPLLQIGALESLRAVMTEGEDLITLEVRKHVLAGKARYVGGTGMGQPDYELVKLVNPDVSFVYTGDSGQLAMIGKLNELGLNYAVNNEYMEEHYLGRMEWLKFMAAFYDKEFVAEKIINDAIKEINSIATMVEGRKKPKVIWVNCYADKTYVPNAGSYVGKWLEMAGGDYAFKNFNPGKNGSTMINNEELYAKAKDADIMIFSSTVNFMANPTIRGITSENPLLLTFKSIKEGNVYAYSADWWETIPETDKFIKSIAAVFYPELFKGYKPEKLVKLPR